MRVTGLGWVGTRTDDAEKLAHFYENVLGLSIFASGDDFWAFKLPDGSIVSALASTENRAHFSTGPVFGLSVEDFPSAVDELKRAGIELLGESGRTFQHFRGPDGSVCELFSDGWRAP